jgi:hypothetical protein
MGKINWVRVLLGGLVAGAIINVSEFVTNGLFLADQWRATTRTPGLMSAQSASIVFLIWGFLMGIGAIWLYAVARPRLGPGIRTAVKTGFAFWCLSPPHCAQSTRLRQEYTR